MVQQHNTGKSLTVMNFRTSSMANTGALRYSTAFHSTHFKGVMAKSDYTKAHEHMSYWKDGSRDSP